MKPLIHSATVAFIAGSVSVGWATPASIPSAPPARPGAEALVGWGSPVPCDPLGNTRGLRAVGGEVARIRRESGKHSPSSYDWVLAPAGPGPGSARVSLASESDMTGSVGWPAGMGWANAPRHLYLWTTDVGDVPFAVAVRADGRDDIEFHLRAEIATYRQGAVCTVGTRTGLESFAKGLPTTAARTRAGALADLMATMRLSREGLLDASSPRAAEGRVELGGEVVGLQGGQCWFFAWRGLRGMVAVHEFPAYTHGEHPDAPDISLHLW